MRRPSASRFLSAGIAGFVLSSTLSACGGGGHTASTLPAVAGAPALAQQNGVMGVAGSSAAYRLGLVGADAPTIAALRVIRHSLSYTPLPAAFDLSPKMPPIGNQGQEGSCVSWASAYAMRGYEARQDVWSTIAPSSADPSHNFSPAFVYNQLNGGSDNGTTIPSALNLLQKTGAATLADMPYVNGQFTTAPSAAAFADAVHYRLSSFGYIAPTDITSMKAQVAAGLPVILAIKVYNNFFALGNGQTYTATGGGYAGGHAVTIVGYDDAKGALKVMNSWGTNWGSNGFGWVAYTALPQIALEAYSAIDDHGAPSATAVPIPAPPSAPTSRPTAAPTARPTMKPTAAPTAKPTPKPTPRATAKPTAKPTSHPTAKPTAKPAPQPSPSAIGGPRS